MEPFFNDLVLKDDFLRWKKAQQESKAGIDILVQQMVNKGLIKIAFKPE